MSFVIRKMRFINKNSKEEKDRYSVGHWNPDGKWENRRHFPVERPHEADLYCCFLNGGKFWDAWDTWD